MRNTSKVGVASGALLVVVATAWGAGPAQAQTDTTTASVAVQQVIAITVDGAFALDGVPGETAVTDPEVEFTVTTNEPDGYFVTVQPVDGEMVPPDAVENPDVIPFGDLEVANADTGAFSPLDPDTPVEIYSQDTGSDPGGDTFTHAYQLDVPFVQPDTYTGVITYVATVNT